MIRRPAFIFLACVAGSLLTRALFIPVEILDMDEASHAVGSWVWMNGGQLYEDFINNKPPLLYAYYAFAQIIFGKGLVAVHIMTALIVVPFTAFAASAFFDHRKAGVLAAALYLIYSAAFLAHDMHSTNAEILMVLPGAWAIVLVRNHQLAESKFRMLVAGFLFGLGFLFKYQIALGILPIAIASARTHTRRWIYLLPGFFVAPVITIFLFHRAGGLDDLLYWLFWNNLLYSANPISLWEALGRAASYLLPFLLITAPLWFLWIRARGLFDEYRKILTTWLIIVSIPPLFVGFRFFPHYFIQLYFPLVIAATPAIIESFRRKAFIVYSIAILIVSSLTNAYLYFGNRKVYRERDPVYAAVAERLKSDRCFKNATLFVWGYAPAFYYHAGLQPATRFVVMGQARLTGYVSGNLESLDRASGTGVAQHWDWLMSDLKTNHCTYILDTAPANIYRWNRFPMDAFPRLRNYVAENFEWIAVVDDVVIYRRNQCSSE